MGTYLRRIRFENKGNSYTMRCHFCHRPKKELYQARFQEGGPSYMLCPGNCLRQAHDNYNAKLKNGVMPTMTDTRDTSFNAFNEIQEESLQDNIDKE